MAEGAGLPHDICAPLGATMSEATLEERARVRLMTQNSAELIAGAVRESGAAWVWVEGFSQAGKSVFASKLALALGWVPVIYLDHMTLEIENQPDSPRYADHLDRDRILQVVESGRPLVVEGVCLEDVVGGMKPDAAVRIYVARVSRPTPGSLIWHDGVEMQEPERERDNWLARDILSYHCRVLPHANSDFVLVRVEDDTQARAGQGRNLLQP
jgi:hypothetical protein